ncbi:UDP-N-acetylmuramate--L-alanine ligase [Streptomyces prasinosporus]|uniref:UDP-N-acetylmuramate--L-alanine ligase n=2 Tax=Streptomyces TaxID=1883 RepID=A0ABP6U2S2_9ACTN|nr:Mur ligase domain-containing protein [Streptomyces tricolor]MCG0062088.1 Mur ligase domain-containing protein [Streptomyces tricolor]GHC14628.1 UDP-N-acetylmuramate--L-alanine ligase [Streptomyces albogriseolus]
MAETAIPTIVPSLSAGEPVDLSRPHFVGIAGTGMLPVARVCAERGLSVSGSDVTASQRVEELARLGVTVHTGHAAEQLPADATAVVFTHAIAPDNPEILAARERGVPVVHRSAALDALMSGRRAVGVLGTHGKSSTAGMLAVTLSRMGESPSYAVGADLEGPGSGGRAGDGSVFIAEVDESDRTLLGVRVNVAVVTNIDYDHPENYASAADYLNAFEASARGMGAEGTVVLNADSAGCIELASRLKTGEGPRVVMFGASSSADWCLSEMASADGRSSALLCGPQGRQFHLSLRIPGVHQLMNAAAAVAALHVLDQDLDLAMEQLGYYGSVQRRMTSAGMMAGVRIYDSYAHHPTEVAADLSAARSLAGTGRLIMLFRPTGQARLDTFGAEVGKALAGSDAVVLTGDARLSEASLRELSVSIGQAGGSVLAVETAREDAVVCASKAAQADDVVVLMGTGDLSECGLMLRRTLADMAPVA